MTKRLPFSPVDGNRRKKKFTRRAPFQKIDRSDVTSFVDDTGYDFLTDKNPNAVIPFNSRTKTPRFSNVTGTVQPPDNRVPIPSKKPRPNVRPRPRDETARRKRMKTELLKQRKQQSVLETIAEGNEEHSPKSEIQTLVIHNDLLDEEENSDDDMDEKSDGEPMNLTLSPPQSSPELLSPLVRATTKPFESVSPLVQATALKWSTKQRRTPPETTRRAKQTSPVLSPLIQTTVQVQYPLSREIVAAKPGERANSAAPVRRKSPRLKQAQSTPDSQETITEPSPSQEKQYQTPAQPVVRNRRMTRSESLRTQKPVATDNYKPVDEAVFRAMMAKPEVESEEDYSQSPVGLVVHTPAYKHVDGSQADSTVTNDTFLEEQEEKFRANSPTSQRAKQALLSSHSGLFKEIRRPADTPSFTKAPSNKEVKQRKVVLVVSKVANEHSPSSKTRQHQAVTNENEYSQSNSLKSNRDKDESVDRAKVLVTRSDTPAIKESIPTTDALGVTTINGDSKYGQLTGQDTPMRTGRYQSRRGDTTSATASIVANTQFVREEGTPAVKMGTTNETASEAQGLRPRPYSIDSNLYDPDNGKIKSQGDGEIPAEPLQRGGAPKEQTAYSRHASHPTGPENTMQPSHETPKRSRDDVSSLTGDSSYETVEEESEYSESCPSTPYIAFEPTDETRASQLSIAVQSPRTKPKLSPKHSPNFSPKRSPILWTTELAGRMYKECGINAAPRFRLANGGLFQHPLLPPGWTIEISKSKNLPYYTHPDFGVTYFCPVPLPSAGGGFHGTVSEFQLVQSISPVRSVSVPKSAAGKGDERHKPKDEEVSTNSKESSVILSESKEAQSSSDKTTGEQGIARSKLQQNGEEEDRYDLPPQTRFDESETARSGPVPENSGKKQKTSNFEVPDSEETVGVSHQRQISGSIPLFVDVVHYNDTSPTFDYFGANLRAQREEVKNKSTIEEHETTDANEEVPRSPEVQQGRSSACFSTPSSDDEGDSNIKDWVEENLADDASTEGAITQHTLPPSVVSKGSVNIIHQSGGTVASSEIKISLSEEILRLSKLKMTQPDFEGVQSPLIDTTALDDDYGPTDNLSPGFLQDDDSVTESVHNQVPKSVLPNPDLNDDMISCKEDSSQKDLQRSLKLISSRMKPTVVPIGSIENDIISVLIQDGEVLELRDDGSYVSHGHLSYSSSCSGHSAGSQRSLKPTMPKCSLQDFFAILRTKKQTSPQKTTTKKQTSPQKTRANKSIRKTVKKPKQKGRKPLKQARRLRYS